MPVPIFVPHSVLGATIPVVPVNLGREEALSGIQSIVVHVTDSRYSFFAALDR
jgi:hypothetical protein